MPAHLRDAIEKLALHDHIALFHRNRREALAVLVPYLRSGLSRGEKCLLICDPALGDEALAGLRGLGVDVGNAVAKGSILVTPAVATSEASVRLDPDGMVGFFRAVLRQAASERYAALRIGVDIPHVLGNEPDRETLREYQKKFHLFLQESPALSLCLHGAGDFSPEARLEVLRVHPLIACDAKLIENFYFVPPGAGPLNPGADEEFLQRLSHLEERHGQLTRIRRQAIRLKRFQDITNSLLRHAAVPDLFKGIAEGVISLGYRMCWIGMAKPDGSVEVVSSWGDRRGYLQEIEVRWDDTPRGHGPVGNAIRTGKPDIVRDITRSARFLPWRDKALANGFRSVAAVPLREDGKVVGALAVYAEDHNAFDREAVEELAAFALEASLVLQRTREFRKLSLSEERFRRLFEQIPAACFTCDRDGIIRHWNLHCQRVYGYAREDAVGMPVFRLVRPEDQDTARETLSRVFGGDSIFNREWKACCLGGETRWVLSTIYPFRGTSDAVELGVSVNIDITDRLRLEEEKEEIRRKLLQAQKMEAVGSLAKAIAQEFNHLLGSVVENSASLGSRMDPGDPLRSSVEEIRRAAGRAVELNAKLLGFSRGGKFRLRPVSLNDVVGHVVPLLRKSFGPSIEIRTELDPSVFRVEADDEQMEHCLLNLCLNARDAMPEGGVLTITTGNVRLSADEAARYHVPGPGTFIFLEVRDTGEGIAADILPRIFEPFFTTRRERGCSGMGLAMAYGIVKSHFGGLHVESSPGSGAVFRIHLPATAGKEIAVLPAEAYPKGAETVLLVDDEPSIRDMGASLLSALGYRVLLAEDGEAGCRVLRERPGEVDLVILDLVMPKMGAMDAFRAVRDIAPGVPVLLSSGYSVEGPARDILREGADAFIQKPYGMSDLARAVRRILDARRVPETPATS